MERGEGGGGDIERETEREQEIEQEIERERERERERDVLSDLITGLREREECTSERVGDCEQKCER